MKRLRYLLRMAVRDLVHEWSVSLAVACAITAVAAPILVLLGLYQGVVSDVFTSLREDPGAREVRLTATGASRFTSDWFDDVRTWDEVAFVAPSTRYAAAQGQAINSDGSAEARANLIPTLAADPVFGLAWPGVGDDRAGISAPLARKLNAKVGEVVSVEITRGGASGGEAVFVDLTIEAIARDAYFARDALFVSPDLLLAVEDYKDGFAALGEAGESAPVRAYVPDFRLYARDIRDVGPLVARLSAPPHELTLHTEAGRIDFALQLDESLSLIVFAVGALGVLGLGGGLAAVQWSMAARRRRTIAVLNLIGFSRLSLILLPVLQSVILGLIGAGLTIAVSFGLSGLIEGMLPPGVGLSGLSISGGAAASVGAMIMVISVLPAIWIGVSYSNLEASDEIRDT
ncbi:MAG: FtsX-like permease family protein [Pikeienuella sp.]